MVLSFPLVYNNYSLKLWTRVRIIQTVVPGNRLDLLAPLVFLTQDYEVSSNAGFSQHERVGRKLLEATDSLSLFPRWENRPKMWLPGTEKHLNF